MGVGKSLRRLSYMIYSVVCHAHQVQTLAADRAASSSLVLKSAALSVLKKIKTFKHEQIVQDKKRVAAV